MRLGSEDRKMASSRISAITLATCGTRGKPRKILVSFRSISDCLGLFQTRLDLIQTRLGLFQTRLGLFQTRLGLFQTV